jgi:hypothetical protein
MRQTLAPRAASPADLSFPPPPAPTLGKNLSDMGVSSGDQPPLPPPMMRFHSHQGGSAPATARCEGGEEPCRHPSVRASGGGEAWVIVLDMAGWSAPLSESAQSVEITATLQLEYACPAGASVQFSVSFVVDSGTSVSAAATTATAFCVFPSRAARAEDTYFQLLKSVLRREMQGSGSGSSGARPRSARRLSRLHGALLAYVLDGGPSPSPSPSLSTGGLELDTALAALALATYPLALASSNSTTTTTTAAAAAAAEVSPDVGIKVLCMVGQLAEACHRGRKDDFPSCIAAAETFRDRARLIRRCQVLCGRFGGGLWAAVQAVDCDSLRAVSAARGGKGAGAGAGAGEDFALSRLVRMGVLFLFSGDVLSLVPCFRALACPATLLHFPSAASVTTNAYDAASHDWNFLSRIDSIKEDQYHIMNLFSPTCSLLQSDRAAFAAEVYTTFEKCHHIMGTMKRALEAANAVTERWDYEFSPSFALGPRGLALPAAPACVRGMRLFGHAEDGPEAATPTHTDTPLHTDTHIDTHIDTRVRKMCVEAQYAFSGLYEHFAIAVEVSELHTTTTTTPVSLYNVS